MFSHLCPTFTGISYGNIAGLSDFFKAIIIKWILASYVYF